VAETLTIAGEPCDDPPLKERGALALVDPGVTLPDPTFPHMTLPDTVVRDVLPWTPEGRAPLHCGSPMEWRSPEPAAMASYSFEPAGRAAALPALWRCRCGFQLDGSGQEAVVAAAAWQSR
jgi:hypothetical protein